MEIAEQLKRAIAEALKKMGIDKKISFSLEHPTELSHGDYATNAALVVSKKMGKNPRDVADELVKFLDPGLRRDDELVEKIEIAGPGFINFFLKDSFFGSSVSEIISAAEDFGTLKINNGKKILVEHSSPNLFKPFHIGHMMNNAIGESLVRLFKSSGADVVAISFPSDVGLGIAKAVYATLKTDHEILSNDNVSIEDKMKFLGECYVQGTKAYDDDPVAAEEIKKINLDIYQGNETPAHQLYEATKKLNMEYFQSTVARLGSHFDDFIFEGEAGIAGEALVRKNLGTVFIESEGAIIYTPTEETKLSTEVFITSAGHPTYGSKDLGLLELKFEKYHPDISAVVTDYQQAHHFFVVLDAAKHINTIWSEHSTHVPHGRMAFKGQKMSSRLGGVPVATEVLEMIGDEVKEKMGEKDLDQKTQDAVAIAAIKFSILRAKPGQNINFDPETSLSFEGDSGPYLQYTHARIQSLIEKASAASLHPKISAEPNVSSHATPSEIERLAYRFPEIVQSALIEYAPNYIATHLIELARAFNSFYGANKIVDVENQEISEHRLAIAQAVAIILKNGLWLLGISAPEKM